MSSTAIEWTDRVWNPTTGCDQVSPGCDHCYALTMAKRLKGMGSAKYQRDGDPRTSGPGFGLSVHPSALTAPLHWRRPARVFVNSMSDLFHADVPDEFIARVWAVMAATPQHTYQVLTKRHGRMRSLLSTERFDLMVAREWTVLGVPDGSLDGGDHSPPWPLPNVWVGVSVEDQKRADLRIPALLDTPAAVRFLSCEPLLGAVDLSRWLDLPPICGCGESPPGAPGAPGCSAWCMSPRPSGLGWVIAGGESGPRSRPMHPGWARQLRDQCQTAGVPFLFKQHGDWAPLPVQDNYQFRMETDHDIRWDGYHWPISQPHGAADGTEVIVRRFGKKGAGRLLDGRTWDQFPVAVSS